LCTVVQTSDLQFGNPKLASSVLMAYSQEVIQKMVALVPKEQAVDDKKFEMLKDFIVYTTAIAEGGVVSEAGSVDTQFGAIAKSDKDLERWLTWKLEESGKNPKTVNNWLVQLKWGVRNSGCAEHPPWVHQTSPEIAKQFRLSKKRSAPGSKAATEGAVVKAIHTEEYGLRMLQRKLKTSVENMKAHEIGEMQRDIRDAFMLRCQSGCNPRSADLTSLKWSALKEVDGVDGGLTWALDTLHTKISTGMSISKVVGLKLKSRMLIKDDVTIGLLNTWVGLAVLGERESEEDYMFPSMVPVGRGKPKVLQPNWKRSMSNSEHNQAVKNLAVELKLASSQEHLKKFTSTAIRRGVSSKHAMVIKEQLAKLNPHEGHSQGSMVGTGSYTPPDVLRAPETMFQPDGQSKARYKAALQEAWDSILCGKCGRPHCKCKRCRWTARSHCTVAHSCWLISTGCGPTPKKGRVMAWDDWIDLKLDWEECMYAPQPVWDTHSKRYTFDPADGTGQPIRCAPR
jgi:hypothetical protein